jgi:hypothetical protein
VARRSCRFAMRCDAELERLRRAAPHAGVMAATPRRDSAARCGCRRTGAPRRPSRRFRTLGASALSARRAGLAGLAAAPHRRHVTRPSQRCSTLAAPCGRRGVAAPCRVARPLRRCSTLAASRDRRRRVERPSRCSRDFAVSRSPRGAAALSRRRATVAACARSELASTRCADPRAERTPRRETRAP